MKALPVVAFGLITTGDGDFFGGATCLGGKTGCFDAVDVFGIVLVDAIYYRIFLRLTDSTKNPKRFDFSIIPFLTV
jgi:hypothetical protein